MRVKDIMTEPVVTVAEGASLEDVARIILDRQIGGVPVVDATGGLTGIITESDFAAKEKSVPFSTFRSAQILGQWLSGQDLKKIYDAARDRRAAEIMTSPVLVLSEDDPVEKAAELLLKHDINRLPVVRGREPVGIVSRRDLLRLMVMSAPK